MCLPTRDILLVVPLQALSNFESAIVGHLGYFFVPAKAFGTYFAAVTRILLFCSQARYSFFKCHSWGLYVCLQCLTEPAWVFIERLAAPLYLRLVAHK